MIKIPSFKLESPKPLNGEGLPPGWSMQLAPNGRMFFIDHNERATTWVDPRTGRPSSIPWHNTAPSATPRSEVDQLGPLPEGWEERVHTDGRIFFIDHSKFKLISFFYNQNFKCIKITHVSELQNMMKDGVMIF